MDYQKLFVLLPKSHTKWTVDDIAIWLQFIGLEALIPGFKEAAIDGSCLAVLTEEDLKEELKIKSGITIKKLSTWIKIGVKEFDDFVLAQSQINRKVESQAVNGSTLGNKSLLKSLPSENNRSKKLLTKALSATETQMEVEVHQKFQEKMGFPNRPINQLLIQQSDGANSFYCLREEGAKIGRHSSNKILILEESVSRYHAQIEYEDGNFYIRDIGSTTGTFIKIVDKIELLEGMIIEMGSNQFQVYSVHNCELTFKVVEGSNIDNPQISVTIPLGGKINCGRKINNAINFPDDQHLSNIHASITNIENRFFLEDMATTNGTWLRLSEEGNESARQLLVDKTVFKIGTTYTYTCTRNGANVVEEKNTENFCIICCQNQKDCVYLPCNHNSACIRCSKTLKECPICRRKIEDFIKIYRS